MYTICLTNSRLPIAHILCRLYQPIVHVVRNITSCFWNVIGNVIMIGNMIGGQKWWYWIGKTYSKKCTLIDFYKIQDFWTIPSRHTPLNHQWITSEIRLRGWKRWFTGESPVKYPRWFNSEIPPVIHWWNTPGITESTMNVAE